MRGKQQPVPAGLAVHAVTGDQREHRFRAFTDPRDHPLGYFRRKCRANAGGRRVQIGHHLAEIAARGPLPDLTRLEHDHPHPLFGQMQRGGQAGEAAADHRNVGLVRAVELCGLRR